MLRMLICLVEEENNTFFALLQAQIHEHNEVYCRFIMFQMRGLPYQIWEPFNATQIVALRYPLTLYQNYVVRIRQHINGIQVFQEEIATMVETADVIYNTPWIENTIGELRVIIAATNFRNNVRRIFTRISRHQRRQWLLHNELRAQLRMFDGQR